MKNSSTKNKKENKKFIISPENDNYNNKNNRIIKKRKTKKARTKISNDLKDSMHSNYALNQRNTSNNEFNNFDYNLKA